MHLKLKTLFLIYIICLLSAKGQEKLPLLKKNFQDAIVKTNGSELIVSTSKIQRTWKWTGKGLVTTSLKNTKTGKEWATLKPQFSSDWAYYGLIDETEGKLLSLTAQKGNDEGFTSDFLEVIAEVQYPSVETTVKYQIWAYPGAPGIFTRVWFKGKGAQYFKGVSKEDVQAIDIKQLSGKTHKPYLDITVPQWTLSQTADPNSIEYHITGVNPKREYILGLSWWGSDKERRTQKVRVTSVDGETIAELIGPSAVTIDPATVTAKVPVNKVVMDNSFRVFIDKQGEGDARLSEIWLYEKTDKAGTVKKGVIERISELNKLAPQGYKLTAYYDSGENQDDEKFIATGRVDYVPVAAAGKGRRYIGYYNDTQHRNTPQTPIYHEEFKTTPQADENINWANIVSVEDKDEGFILVKESHKCVNQYGTDTGDFLVASTGISNTGTSLYPKEIEPETYKWSWASWAIVYDGNEDYRELAVKQFDRYRFPTNRKRDMYSLVCTWGNSKNGRDGRNYATEKEVLAEMKATDELGIDLLLIDDGWQVSRSSPGYAPEPANGWKPHPNAYPERWKNVAALKEKLNLELGLWGVAQNTTVDEMVWNWEHLKMKQFKLDFASFNNHDVLDNMMGKAREFMLKTKHQSIISWDLTENAPRYGYFWAREYGNLHFMNRKDEFPANAIYIPWLCLRDYWHLSSYNNLNKYQLTVQNPEITNQKLSDAYKHNLEYCVATTLMGVPEFMAMPRFFSNEAKASVKALLKIYKNQRKNIWESYQFPIGEQPSNASFTGFQSFHPEKKEGYFIFYRELNAPENRKEIDVKFLEGRKVTLTDLQTGQKWRDVISAKGMLGIAIDKPANFRFIKYKVID